MRYSVAALLALASSVLAQVEGFDVMTQPGENEVIPAGETYEIVWTPDADYADKPVSIILIGGESQPKQIVLETLATGIPSDAGSFTWKVDDSLGKDKVYGIKIMLEEDPEIFQYSFPFAITPDEDHGDHSSAAPSSALSSTPSTKTKSVTTKPSDYPTATPSASSSFSSVYLPSNASSIITPSGTPTPTGSGSGFPSSTTSSTTTAQTAAATAFAANGLAVIGGFAMAVLAL
ncbi:Ser-Thr-rich glycosyl-phosphatidyl-inositol-anchored membrane family-domain-containing protein [Rhypophila decipiens]|uniref:Ser-Thr-rich glycosyl-phosphatidyl-inositol-anchored membrane family-domain-containing protein n=1 Tax=Rhypophila decipiens TaxID=261697 RepID=A0AAN6YB07_9PEZI|nr:Ser-Thr-rich glycosyl-phosphatidyl-inositol-anchored membrane family-domain-containing protein [Rhypophila decipiens]